MMVWQDFSHRRLQQIHIAPVNTAGIQAFCGVVPPADALVVIAPHDDPRTCVSCVKHAQPREGHLWSEYTGVGF